METNRVYEASAADYQNRLRLAGYMGAGTLSAREGGPTAVEFLVAMAILLAMLALLVGALA